MIPGSRGRETGRMLQGKGTAGGSFWRRPWLKMGCCANEEDDETFWLICSTNV